MNLKTTGRCPTCLSCRSWSRVAVKQHTDYLETSGLLPLLQSAYRSHHSTETVLLKVLSDVLTVVDKKVTLLALLDLSAAFDCVDHDILLSRLQSRFGLDGTVLAWIQFFYLPQNPTCLFRWSSDSMASIFRRSAWIYSWSHGSNFKDFFLLHNTPVPSAPVPLAAKVTLDRHTLRWLCSYRHR